MVVADEARVLRMAHCVGVWLRAARVLPVRRRRRRLLVLLLLLPMWLLLGSVRVLLHRGLRGAAWLLFARKAQHWLPRERRRRRRRRRRQ